MQDATPFVLWSNVHGRWSVVRGRLFLVPRRRSVVVSCGGKAKRRLGRVPRVGLEEGLRRTIAWYRECLK
jgi:nucleoside-diphosphate-sugar epimerase